MPPFDHERLDVYRVAVKLVAAVHGLSAGIRRGNADLVDQTRRAAISIPLNIAEGAGEYSPNEKLRFYRIARRSAAECSAALDVLHALELATDEDLQYPRDLLDRIIAMLTALIRERTTSISRPSPRPSPRPTGNPRRKQ